MSQKGDKNTEKEPKLSKNQLKRDQTKYKISPECRVQEPRFLQSKVNKKWRQFPLRQGVQKTKKWVEKKGEDQTNKHNRNTKKEIRNNSNNTKQERQQENKQDNGKQRRRKTQITTNNKNKQARKQRDKHKQKTKRKQRNTTRKEIKHRTKQQIDTQKNIIQEKIHKTRTNDNKKTTNTYTNKNIANT